MNRATKFWLVTASVLFLIGGIVFAGGMSVLKWDFTKLSSIKFETNDYIINGEYRNISIVTDTADIEFTVSDDSTGSVICYEYETQKHSVSVKDDTLVIEIEDTRKWYEYIGINFGTPKITVILPGGVYGALTVKSSTGDLNIPADFNFESVDITESTGNVTNYASVSDSVKIKTGTGKITLENLKAGSLDLSVSTGKVVINKMDCHGDININVSTGKTEITDTKCANLTSNGSTGAMILTNAVASEGISINRSTGDVKLEGCDAAELHIKTNTGDVKGSLLSEKVFITESDTGHINIPQTTSGGVCEISTDTGNINITVE